VKFGLRIALGASSGQIVTSVLRDAFVLAGIGLAIGFASSLAAGRGLGNLLYGITPTDAVTYGGVFVSLSLASLIACYLPARRAARVDPMHALRQEQKASDKTEDRNGVLSSGFCLQVSVFCL
jgi:putative ABC transport system permease protein